MSSAWCSQTPGPRLLGWLVRQFSVTLPSEDARAAAAAGDYVVRTSWHGDFGFSQRFDGSMRDVLAWTLPLDVTMVVGSLTLGTGSCVSGRAAGHRHRAGADHRDHGLIVVGNMLADAVQAWLDPRVR